MKETVPEKFNGLYVPEQEDDTSSPELRRMLRCRRSACEDIDECSTCLFYCRNLADFELWEKEQKGRKE